MQIVKNPIFQISKSYIVICSCIIIVLMSVKAFIKYAVTTTHKNNVTGDQIDAEIKTSALYIFLTMMMFIFIFI